MLRRDTEYVLTWHAPGHAWLVRPLRRDGERIIRIGPGSIQIDAPAWTAAHFEQTD